MHLGIGRSPKVSSTNQLDGEWNFKNPFDIYSGKIMVETNLPSLKSIEHW